MTTILTRPVTWAYDVDPSTGATFAINPGGNWVRTNVPRSSSPAFGPPPPKVMRDVTDPTTYASTGGTPVSRPAAFRTLFVTRRR